MKIAIIYDTIYLDHISGGTKRNWEVVRWGHEVWLWACSFGEGVC